MTRKIPVEPSEEQFHRIVFSIWDFQQALSALTFLEEECDLTQKYSRVELRRFKCYETQSIISFARPFVASRSGIQLSAKRVGVNLTSEEREHSNEILLLRNKIVAHSDTEEMHYKVQTLEFGGQNSIKAPVFIFDEGLLLTGKQRRDFESLLRKLIHGLHEFAFQLCKSNPERFEFYKVPISGLNQDV
ncbi:hypothetical protein [Pseudomonas moraviensis]|uniref:hypothetical protein n=1 Tax=Pseudomonas moraviensis TaxID=321662 RepID=UPI00087C06C4|nr:hypothetical protein [Pseudomonas moraviensis]SDU17691.1 hypothetical protein SAMN04490196_0835 [Pseudomonas moraviensis]